MFRRWFERQGRATALFRERLSNFWIHRALLFGRIPAIFLDPAVPRLERWPHEDDAAAPAHLAPAA